MNQAYWDGLARSYDDRVLSSLDEDRNGVIRRHLDRLAGQSRHACDVGCGVGHYLPDLSRRFASVTGIDLSGRLLAVAEQRAADLPNIELRRVDLLARRRPKLRPTDVVVCANVLITEDDTTRSRLLTAVSGLVRPGGALLMIVPALESALWANRRLVEWNLKEGLPSREAAASGIPHTAAAARSLLAGVVRNDGVPTKHFLQEELITEIEATGLRIGAVERVEYGWHTEFENPPKWMGAPFPWDWLVLATRPTA